MSEETRKALAHNTVTAGNLLDDLFASEDNMKKGFVLVTIMEGQGDDSPSVSIISNMGAVSSAQLLSDASLKVQQAAAEQGDVGGNSATRH